MAKKAAKRNIQIAAYHIKRHLDAHPGTPVNTAELARDYGVSRSALEKFFKGKYKQPIGQYKLGLRLKYAQDLLRAGHSIKEVTIMLQYSSPSSFSNAFRNFFDISAKQWLHEIKYNGNTQGNV